MKNKKFKSKYVLSPWHLTWREVKALKSHHLLLYFALKYMFWLKQFKIKESSDLFLYLAIFFYILSYSCHKGNDLGRFPILVQLCHQYIILLYSFSSLPKSTSNGFVALEFHKSVLQQIKCMWWTRTNVLTSSHNFQGHKNKTGKASLNFQSLNHQEIRTHNYYFPSISSVRFASPWKWMK